jgi:hypothetical protein
MGFFLAFFQKKNSALDHEACVRGHSHDRLPCCGIGFGWFL